MYYAILFYFKIRGRKGKNSNSTLKTQYRKGRVVVREKPMLILYGDAFICFDTLPLAIQNLEKQLILLFYSHFVIESMAACYFSSK